MKIYFDMDGVLADFDAVANKIYGRRDLNASASALSPEQAAAKNERWHIIEKTDGFWENLPLVPGARALVSAAAARGEVFILSKTYGPHKFVGGDAYVRHIGMAKKEWAAAHFGEFFRPENVLIVSGPKGETMKPTQSDILIDDRPDNIAEWCAAGGRGIVFVDADQTIKELSQLL
ncbi:MAG: hypothetical protein FWC51_00990 [Proteobacteria bacterium]|nr:hypothetical protein [Pseudomonadota bacterium]